jgi:hypothetical protein
MPESDHSQENIAYIRTHVDNLERMVRFQIASNPASRLAIREHLKAREGAAQFYCALSEGPRTQQELAAVLKISQPTVSRIAGHLFDANLIIKIPGAKPGMSAYAMSDLEQLLGVSKIARKLVGEGAKKKAGRSGKDSSEVPSGGSLGSDSAGDEQSPSNEDSDSEET